MYLEICPIPVRQVAIESVHVQDKLDLLFLGHVQGKMKGFV